MDKLLTVIVPVYKVEAYLEKCVDSILEQTYSKLELILVDDGSPDKCPKLCDEYKKKDSRVKVIHKENGGQGSARNMGIDIAQGDYIAFVDSDDYIEPNMYEIMIEALERTGSDMSFCGFFSHSGLRIAESSSFKEEHVWENPEELLKALFNGEAIGNPWNKVCKRELYDDIRFPEGVAREDIYIMHTLYGKCNRAVHTGKCLYNYIIREGSSEHQDFSPKFLISISISDKRCEYIKNNFPSLIPLAIHSCYGSRLSAIKKIVRSDAEKDYYKEYNELKNYIKNHEPTSKAYKRIRREILYFPHLYKLRMNYQYKWRKRIKFAVLRVKNGKWK